MIVNTIINTSVLLSVVWLSVSPKVSSLGWDEAKHKNVFRKLSFKQKAIHKSHNCDKKMLNMCVILMFLPAFYTVKAGCGTGVEPSPLPRNSDCGRAWSAQSRYRPDQRSDPPPYMQGAALGLMTAPSPSTWVTLPVCPSFMTLQKQLTGGQSKE